MILFRNKKIYVLFMYLVYVFMSRCTWGTQGSTSALSFLLGSNSGHGSKCMYTHTQNTQINVKTNKHTKALLGPDKLSVLEHQE